MPPSPQRIAYSAPSPRSARINVRAARYLLRTIESIRQTAIQVYRDMPPQEREKVRRSPSRNAWPWFSGDVNFHANCVAGDVRPSAQDGVRQADPHVEDGR